MFLEGKMVVPLTGQGSHPGSPFSPSHLRELGGSVAAEMAPGRTQRKTLQQMTHPPTPPLPTWLQRQALATGLSRRLFQCSFTHTLQNKTNYDFATSQFRDCLLTSSGKFQGPGSCISLPLPLPDPCISLPPHRLNICYHHFC